MTLPFLLGPVPWSLSTPDRISTKTNKSKLPHGLQSHIEPTLDSPCSAAHNFDVNIVTTKHNSFSCHLRGSDGTSIQGGTKETHGMLVSIGHNVDLELTLPFLLGPVPWSLSTPDRISTKTNKSKLPHGLQSHIEPTLDSPCSAAHNFDVNIVTTKHNSFSCHLRGSDGTSIQGGTKETHGMLVLSLIHIYNV